MEAEESLWHRISAFAFAFSGVMVLIGLMFIGRAAMDISQRDSPAAKAKALVSGMCKTLDAGVSLSTMNMLSMSNMRALYGGKQVDGWCDCAYGMVSTVISDEQILSAVDAGIYNPITDQLETAVTYATARCILSSDVPAAGRQQANDFAKLLVQSRKTRSDLSDALKGATR
jgi:hypothetical protein